MTQDSADAHVRRLWRHRGTTVPAPRRGPRGELDLDDILTAAIALADASGLDAVSTRAVAAHFGKTPMALYAYVGTKENLLALMQDHASSMPPWADPGPALFDDLSAWAFAAGPTTPRAPTSRTGSNASSASSTPTRCRGYRSQPS
jgi:AcrR family transcriptional regulator